MEFAERRAYALGTFEIGSREPIGAEESHFGEQYEAGTAGLGDSSSGSVSVRG